MSQLAPNTQGSKYSDEQRRQALIEYSTCGHIPTVSKNLSIPESTLKTWKQTEWWVTALDEVRLQNKDLMEAHLQNLVLKGFEGMQKRIDQGDAYVTKDGEIAYKPVSLRDLSTATGISFDKLRLIRNEPTSIKAESTDKRLSELAEKVRELQGGTRTIDHQDDETG